MEDSLIWLGVVACLSQSAILSGSNLALFSMSKLRLELEEAQGNRDAMHVLRLREDSNRLLATILWGNVAVNVLLALLAGSVLSGVLAFLFSTVVITIVGEIFPQAYFTRHALWVGARLSPLLRIYRAVLYPVAKPTALMLDLWLGKEGVTYFKEAELRALIALHGDSAETEIGPVEAVGARNFLDLDDVPLYAEGEPIDPESVIRMPFRDNLPVFPSLTPAVSDPFLHRIHRSRKKWVILLDPEDRPRMVLNAHTFLRDCLFHPDDFHPYAHCHRPIFVRDGRTTLGRVIPQFQVHPVSAEDDVIDRDIILLWGKERRIITGSDILGRLLRGIVANPAASRYRP